MYLSCSLWSAGLWQISWSEHGYRKRVIQLGKWILDSLFKFRTCWPCTFLFACRCGCATSERKWQLQQKKSHCVRREPESNIKLASGAAVFSPFVFYQLKCVSQKENTVVNSFVVVSLVAFRASTHTQKKNDKLPQKRPESFSNNHV